MIIINLKNKHLNHLLNLIKLIIVIYKVDEGNFISRFIQLNLLYILVDHVR